MYRKNVLFDIIFQRQFQQTTPIQNGFRIFLSKPDDAMIFPDPRLVPCFLSYEYHDYTYADSGVV